MSGRKLKMLFFGDILMRHGKVKRWRFTITSDLTLPHRFEMREDGSAHKWKEKQEDVAEKIVSENIACQTLRCTQDVCRRRLWC